MWSLDTETLNFMAGVYAVVMAGEIQREWKQPARSESDLAFATFIFLMAMSAWTLGLARWPLAIVVVQVVIKTGELLVILVPGCKEVILPR